MEQLSWLFLQGAVARTVVYVSGMCSVDLHSLSNEHNPLNSPSRTAMLLRGRVKKDRTFDRLPFASTSALLPSIKTISPTLLMIGCQPAILRRMPHSNVSVLKDC